jgi:hypothetical protein
VFFLLFSLTHPFYGMEKNYFKPFNKFDCTTLP